MARVITTNAFLCHFSLNMSRLFPQQTEIKRETRCFPIFHISSSLGGRITGLFLSLSLSSFSDHLRLMTATEWPGILKAWRLMNMSNNLVYMEHVRGIFVLLIMQVFSSGYKIKIPSDSSQERHTMNYVSPACFLQPVHSDFLRMAADPEGRAC